ncbi:MAG TPA: hypothetical protein VE399_05300 [Gemmatimonadales bacterium]|jgi:hypothetical protein|nr:hypothetical protein [Gemmatimonadales bacterium]
MPYISTYSRRPCPRAIATLLLSGSLAACGDTATESPPELAIAVTGPIQWDPKSEMKQIARTRGCDSWTPTWAPDGNLYTAYGDCRPRHAPQKLGMGFGRISGASAYSVSFTPIATGDPLDWDDTAVGAGVEALGDGPDSEKPAGMLHVDGRLWYWIRNIHPGGTGIRLKSSGDYSTTNPQFTWTDWVIDEVGYASFAQYGKAYGGGPSGYVYAVVPMRSDAAGSVSNSAYDLVPAFTLIRGRRADLTVQGDWEFFCGSSSAPLWCASSGSARPVLYRSAKKFAPRAGMSWNPGLGKFMLSLVFDPTPATTGDSPRFYGGLMVLLSSQPWGPWQVVFNSGKTWPGGPSTTTCGPTNWGAGERADIPTKYMSADGKTFYLFSSGGDCLSIARGRLP